MKKAQAKLRTVAIKIAQAITKTSLPEIAFVSSLIFGHYLLNADLQYPSEVIIPVIFFAVVATILFYSYRLLTRSWIAARIATLITTYALYSYGYLPNSLRFGKFMLPRHFETAFSVATVTVIIIAILAGLIGYGISKLVSRVTWVRHLQLHRIILFVLLFTFSIQVVKVTNRLIMVRTALAYKYEMPDYAQDKNTVTAKPDIYYFVFDRYANSNVLKDNFGYDNSPLMSFLAGQGFTTRLDGMSNYPFTMQSISSTLAMDYHTDLEGQFNKGAYQSAFPYRYILNNPPVAKLLRDNGYKYNQVSSWWDFTRVAVQADGQPTKSFRLRAFGKNFYLSDLTRDIVNKSIMSPWLKKGSTVGSKILIKYDNDNNPRQNFFAQKDAIKSIAGTKAAQPQFTFAHFLAPHDPYIFSADGGDPGYDGGRNDYGADEKVKYTNSLTYVNTQIEEMVAYIRQNSPNAVIILQADEGPYPKQFRYDKLTTTHYYDPVDLSLADEKQKFGILASYYMPGQDDKAVTEGINSSVNAFRFVLKTYLGYKLDLLPDCQFSAANKFQLFKFQNETPKLQANPSPACETLRGK